MVAQEQKTLLKEFPYSPGGSDAQGKVVVYTDGSCISGFGSGAGINFGDGHPLTTAVKLDPLHDSGLAEIAAAQHALDSLSNCPSYRGEPVVVRTDYLALVDAMNTGNYGRFQDEYKRLRKTAEKFPHGVTFEHVYGHVGNIGNEKADRLAWEATQSARRRRSLSRSNVGERRNSRSRSRNRRLRSRSLGGGAQGRSRSTSAHVPHRSFSTVDPSSDNSNQNAG